EDAEEHARDAAEQQHPPVLVLVAPADGVGDAADPVCERKDAERQGQREKRDAGLREDEEAEQDPEHSADERHPPVAGQNVGEHARLLRAAPQCNCGSRAAARKPRGRAADPRPAVDRAAKAEGAARAPAPGPPTENKSGGGAPPPPPRRSPGPAAAGTSRSGSPRESGRRPAPAPPAAARPARCTTRSTAARAATRRRCR